MEIKEYIETSATECQKSFVIAPVLIYGGIAYRKVLPNWLSASLVIIGGATLYYNAKNYLETEKLNKEK